MDKASDCESGDSRFESWRGRLFFVIIRKNYLLQAINNTNIVVIDQPGSLFCHSDNRAISVNQFNSELRRCLAFCGLNPQRYTHSFRIGAACLAAEKGFSDAQIRALGRWKSDAFKLYIRNSTLPTF